MIRSKSRRLQKGHGVAIDTGRKLNVHKTFRRRPGRLLNVLCTFNLGPVSTGVLTVLPRYIYFYCRNKITKITALYFEWNLVYRLLRGGSWKKCGHHGTRIVYSIFKFSTESTWIPVPTRILNILGVTYSVGVYLFVFFTNFEAQCKPLCFQMLYSR